MSESFPLSEESQSVLRYAYQLAQDYAHPVVFPEHLLLSISAYRTYLAYHLLSALGVDMEQLGNQCQISIAKRAALIGQPGGKTIQISADVQRATEEGAKIAMSQQKTFLDSGFLLLGLLKSGLETAVILKKQGVTADRIQNLIISEDGLPVETPIAPQKPVEKSAPVKQAYQFQVSPVFLTILGITILAGLSAYNGWLAPGIGVFLFVTGGWVVSLCLHEFGHAAVAYWAGDDTVIDKGYLTLNPLRYTHGVLSIVFPIIIVMMGGIGLPGGAVYINRGLIRQKYQHSLVSAAGPFATGIFALLLAIPFLLNIPGSDHFNFWSGMAMLAFLQITALFFNLLPLPGLDGFGILAPYLPEDILRLAYSFGQFTYFLIFFLFLYNQPFQQWFFGNVFQITAWIGIDPVLVFNGLQIFRFWQ
ncbi:MAG TPA: Clp protease N-terminal domain-containing protein [Anaerolineales bacterium]|nr:Clp protease N-terminal domain-containing protein [Anaerolineales bacterium]